MALDLFAVVAPGQARCRRPDARGLGDLAQLGMRVAVSIGASDEQARAEMEAFGGPVVRVTEPLVRRALVPMSHLPDRVGEEVASVDHALVQRLIREMISHAASRRPSVVYCDDGVVGTGLLCAALRLALGHPWAEVEAEREYFERLVHRYAFLGRAELNPSFGRHAELDAQRQYLQELARVSQPGRA